MTGDGRQPGGLAVLADLAQRQRRRRGGDLAHLQAGGEARARALIADRNCVHDTRFVVNFFRTSRDHRLLFGGGESYGYRFPRDIRAVVRKPMLEVFPSLRDVRLDYAWGGTLGITLSRMPHFARLAGNVLTASGYSGHGVGTAIQVGKLLAEATRGTSDGFETYNAIPHTPFPGGGMFRTPLLTLAMTWFAMRDRIGL